MQSGIYKLAGHVLEIKSLYCRIHKQCKDYKCTEIPEFCISINEEDIHQESVKSEKTGNYQEDYLETLAVYRKVVEYLLEFNIVLFHGSVVAVDGMAYLFTARSGTGKSTHTGLWKRMFGERAVIINDDKPLLELTETGVLVYGTPWDGKHHLSTNMSVPLKAICMLQRGSENQIQLVERKKYYPFLLQQIYRPANGELLKKTLILLESVISKVKIYELFCNQELEAAWISYEGMNREET